MIPKPALVALAVACALAPPGPGAWAAADDAVEGVEVVGTAFRLTTADGRVLTGPDLVGAVLTLGDPDGDRLTVRIDAVRPDPKDPDGETTLYTLMVRDPAGGGWRNLCRPDPDGLPIGFPLAGTWTAAGEHLPSPGAFSLTCTDGAIAKCVRMGYKPWKAAADGTPLRPYHQACVRMLRADYCGDGTPHTRPGEPVDVYDALGIQEAVRLPTMAFEAAWSPDGAVCVRRVRVPAAASLAGLARACPDRLARAAGAACTEATARRSPGALVFNRSMPAPPRRDPAAPAPTDSPR